MKTYFSIIKYLQETLLVISIIVLMVLPLVIVFNKEVISGEVTLKLYFIAEIFVFFVMIIRPLADIFTKVKWLRPLVILRKGTGVFSASIIISFILAKLIIDPAGYLVSILTLKYWSMVNYAILAHMADLSAIILIITSNNLSKKLLGERWKKIQKLAYVYFYGGALYVYLSFGGGYLLIMMIIVMTLTLIAFLVNKERLTKTTI